MKLIALALLGPSLLAGCMALPAPPPAAPPPAPAMPDAVRLGCWWVDDFTLHNALAMFELSRAASNAATVEFNAFLDSCNEAAGPGYELDCFNCGASLIDAVWGP